MGRATVKAALPLLFLFLSMPACSGLFYFPDRNLYFPYSKTGYAGNEFFFTSADGTKLLAWYFPAVGDAKPKGTIVQFHGNGENLSSHYLSLVWLTRHGYNLFTFDYRGYGKSEGDPTQEGTYQDGLAALAKARELHDKSQAKSFVVYGQSLGGAIAMRALQDYQPEVALVVMDSTFLSYTDIARKKMKEFWLTWIFSPLSPIFFSDAYGAREAVEKNQRPLLVIHDEEDPSVPFSCGEEIFEVAKSRKQFWVLREGRHIGVFSDPHQERRKAFLDELDRAARTPATY